LLTYDYMLQYAIACPFERLSLRMDSSCDLLGQLTHQGPGFNYNKEHIRLKLLSGPFNLSFLSQY
jgi:hypothetical protein